ncbi:MAG: UDP-N-acetylmuramate dehydrogenase [Oscillospiraceae bacterium]|nr:UDP-N-acetylmuramate dehydrogenase [Oscillospiraceae bacterium]
MDVITAALKEIEHDLPKIAHKYNEPMKDHTSFRIGGSVRAMYFPSAASEIVDMHQMLKKNDITPFILGNGTNLLVCDEPLDMVVINTAKLDYMKHVDELEISAGAGVILSKLAVYAQNLGLSGLEFAHGIPGTLGGAIYMNAGAYDRQMQDIVQCTDAFSASAKCIFDITNSEHEFSYRHSRFMENGEIILGTTLKLKHSVPELIKAKMDALSVRRRDSQPLDMPSAGSVFKRPKDGYVGAMVEQAGLKGFAIGGAQVSEKHAGFIVNRGGATFSDVMQVIAHVKETIFKQFGIELEQEIRIIQ